MLTSEELNAIKERGISQIKKNGQFLEKIKTRKNLDAFFSEQHSNAFELVDCLNCAGCCKNISPIILQNDIDNIAKHLGIKASEFIREYIHMDEDGDFVFNDAPCPFLKEDNYCRIYESRPKACREYPHTDRRKQHEIIELTLENSKVCPAVTLVIEGLKLHPDFTTKQAH